MKIPKPKKINKTRLKKKADALFSKFIRAIGYCQAEGKAKGRCGGSLQTCHIQTRSVLRLRYSPENVLCMCAAHHRYFHQYPLEFVEFLARYYREKLDYVQVHRYEPFKATVESYGEIIKRYDTK